MRHNVISKSGKSYVTISCEDWNKLVELVRASKDCVFYYGGDTHSGAIKKLQKVLEEMENGN